ncbi:ras guanine nucleotide exchange factor P-like [Clytia hemisphaerica]|uniref:BZIP domain-containing protein n=1 Tax=Clytia hemisphaerica TaxID=252671 RepID=A0A7M5X4I8_9CNID
MLATQKTYWTDYAADPGNLQHHQVSNNQDYLSYNNTTNNLSSNINDHTNNNNSVAQLDYNNNNDSNNNNYPTNNNSSVAPTNIGVLNYSEMGPPCSNIKCFDGYSSSEYVKDMIDKINDKEATKTTGYIYDKPIGPDYYAPCGTYDVGATPTGHYDQNNNMLDVAANRYDSFGEMKKSTILAKFYKPDGTPLKSLWDNDALLKEQRSYKYDPKPLERRKNPRTFVPNDKKTNDYWEKRRKNNHAARKSREDRRKKEIEVLKNVSNLKGDNIKLKLYVQKIMAENQNLKYEVEMLKRL